MDCQKCGAPTRVRNTYSETTYDSRSGRPVPMVVRYRTCATCGTTRKTVEVLAATLLTYGGLAHAH
jgi:transcriptional regulator NrdR family protein